MTRYARYTAEAEELPPLRAEIYAANRSSQYLPGGFQGVVRGHTTIYRFIDVIDPLDRSGAFFTRDQALLWAESRCCERAAEDELRAAGDESAADLCRGMLTDPRPVAPASPPTEDPLSDNILRIIGCLRAASEVLSDGLTRIMGVLGAAAKAYWNLPTDHLAAWFVVLVLEMIFIACVMAVLTAR